MGQNEQFLQSNATREAQTADELYSVAQSYANVGFQSSAMGLRTKIGDAIKALDRENGASDIIGRTAHLTAALGKLD
jgi:hypothetical protein